MTKIISCTSGDGELRPSTQASWRGNKKLLTKLHPGIHVSQLPDSS